MTKQREQIRVQEQYEQHMKDQMNHLQDILAKQNELRKFKHDIFNKLGGLKGYLLANDVENGLTYLDTLTDQLQMMTPAFNTGNIALDATLSTKKALAESKGILFETELRVPKNLPIKPEDICVIFGNALDNAIEGCERVQDRKCRISVSLVQVHDHLLCDITNTATEPTHADLATSKEDTENHGFGLNNLKESLAKYDSEPEILWENGQFSLKFTLYLNAIESNRTTTA